MRYLGGKSRIAKQLAEVIDRYRQPGQLVWDAFCGGLSMSVALSKKGPVWSTDACVPLISLYRAVQRGWDPPTKVSKETWQAAKALPDADPMKAFCGFGCSFGARWFQGYAADPNGTRNRDGVPSNFAKGVAAKLPGEVRGLNLSVVDFIAVEPQPTSAVLYLDPPYENCKPYEGGPRFDRVTFVERVQGWARHTHVFVSEYSFPIGECVWERAQTTTVCRDKSRYATAVERLYHLHQGNA